MVEGERRIHLWNARRAPSAAILGRDDAEAREDLRARARLRRPAAGLVRASESEPREGASFRSSRGDPAGEGRNRAAAAGEARPVGYRYRAGVRTFRTVWTSPKPP